ncbi:MAG: archease [Candidatus Omnitrophica bacterium]|nr:archease [Candidatus Omnitrophota bacterium]MCG2703101.1 archease [Candidatus Omnitrophota bacterium]
MTKKSKMARTLRKSHELFEHTADIGLRAFGKDSSELFVNAARGMFSIIACPKKRQPRDIQERSFSVEVSAANREELLVSWLSELLSLSDIHNIIFFQFHLEQLTECSLKARLSAHELNAGYKRKTEIKAVTYHNLNIKTLNNILQAEVIFDV